VARARRSRDAASCTRAERHGRQAPGAYLRKSWAQGPPADTWARAQVCAEAPNRWAGILAMTDLRTELGKLIVAAATSRGSASVSVLVPDAELQAFWVPESTDEPTFLAYSITKTFTAALVLRLCEQGRLSLEDSLARWFPRIAQAERISLRRLLNHTAGIPDYGGNPAYHDGVRSSPSTPWSFDRFGAETFGKGLQFEPGQGWGYSNPGYMLLKRIIEEVAGASYRDLVSESIARPFGLHRTFVPESIEDLGSLAPGTSCFLAPDGSPRDVRKHYHPGWVSHGVVASTSSEIVRFFDLLFRGRFLSPESLDQMTELVPVESPSDSSTGDSSLRQGKPGYGLGLMGDPASPWGLILGHNGGGPCYSASAFHAPGLGGVSVCAMGAIEEDFKAEQVVFGVLDRLVPPSNESQRVGRQECELSKERSR
jgi:D-alanyl-D-alanine carboxypeptidase